MLGWDNNPGAGSLKLQRVPADGGRPHRELSFSGSGFLVTYQLGVAECLLENMPEVVERAPRVFGASAGSLIAAALVCAMNLDNFYRSLKRAAKKSRRSFLGPMNPLVNLVQIIRKGLVENLPDNAHERASGRLFISLTRLSDGQNVLVSDFTSNEELTQALVCSCFVPVYCGLIPPTFRGVRYIDGGFTNFQPLYDMRNTITVSPFSGEIDICPRNGTDCFLLWLGKSSFVLSPENLHRVALALFPPHSKILQRFLWDGYSDALHYLLQNDLLSPDAPIVSKVLSSQYCNDYTPSQEGDQVAEYLEPEARSKFGSLEERLSGYKTGVLGVLPPVSRQKMGIPDTFTSLASYPVHSVAQIVKGWFLDIPKAFGWMSDNVEAHWNTE
ncbi:patatin-like phospholipase domain-containing protein 2 [Scyliorhinus canicula]|uniref:patatin-like phospholipase domain-containing protein 2 n=1 Tax=Scyliorhinus canicula TaxID=7830 RepID=UPI0018F6FBB8|nr:patatin-like phospholipase domain-containing protein 2 [Scyliorhinus canicula]